MYKLRNVAYKDENGEKVMVKKSPMMQRSTEQRSTVDSKRRLTNFKTSVSQSMSAVLRQSTYSVKR